MGLQHEGFLYNLPEVSDHPHILHILSRNEQDYPFGASSDVHCSFMASIGISMAIDPLRRFGSRILWRDSSRHRGGGNSCQRLSVSRLTTRCVSHSRWMGSICAFFTFHVFRSWRYSGRHTTICQLITLRTALVEWMPPSDMSLTGQRCVSRTSVRREMKYLTCLSVRTLGRGW